MRLTNRLLATLVGGAIAVFSALVAVEIVLGYFDRGPWLLPWDRWYQRSQELTWSDRSVVVTFVLIGVMGVFLLAAELWKRPPVALPLNDAAPDMHAEINRRSLEHALSRAALRVDGISGVRIRSGRRRVRVRAATQRRLPGGLEAHVTAEASSVLAGLGLQRPPRLIVNVNSRRPTRGQV